MNVEQGKLRKTDWYNWNASYDAVVKKKHAKEMKMVNQILADQIGNEQENFLFFSNVSHLAKLLFNLIVFFSVYFDLESLLIHWAHTIRIYNFRKRIHKQEHCAIGTIRCYLLRK